MQTDETDEEIAYWKEGLDGSPAVRVQVIREKPVEWAGRKIAGRGGCATDRERATV